MTDEAKKQYFIFASIISIILSFVIVLFLFPMTTSPFFPGAIINITDEGGVIGLVESVINIAVVAGLLVAPIYFGLLWLINRI